MPYLNASKANDDSYLSLYTAYQSSRDLYDCFGPVYFNETVYEENAESIYRLDCEIPPDERNLFFESRCRPWYLAAKADTERIVFNDPYIGQIDPKIFLTLSAAILNITDGSFIGVTASDISTDFIY